MKNGRVEISYPTLKEIQEGFFGEFSRLDDRNKAIDNPAIYPVEISSNLKRLKKEIERQITQTP